jgi:predicted molibdopterin-dependent oxidoreductase YjgC
MAVSRLDKFGTEFDRWGKTKKIDARSVGKVVLAMLIAFGHKSKITTADEIFHELAQQNPMFKGLDYKVIGESGVQLKINK